MPQVLINALFVPGDARQFSIYVDVPLVKNLAATSLNAEIMGWQDRVGSLIVSKLANIIAVPGDPLGDITALERVLRG